MADRIVTTEGTTPQSEKESNVSSPDPSCGRCLHVRSEHRNGACLPSIEGGSACSCTRWVALAPLCGVTATCLNEPEHPGLHWHPDFMAAGDGGVDSRKGNHDGSSEPPSSLPSPAVATERRVSAPMGDELRRHLERALDATASGHADHDRPCWWLDAVNALRDYANVTLAPTPSQPVPIAEVYAFDRGFARLTAPVADE